MINYTFQVLSSLSHAKLIVKDAQRVRSQVFTFRITALNLSLLALNRLRKLGLALDQLLLYLREQS